MREFTTKKIEKKGPPVGFMNVLHKTNRKERKGERKKNN